MTNRLKPTRTASAPDMLISSTGSQPGRPAWMCAAGARPPVNGTCMLFPFIFDTRLQPWSWFLSFVRFAAFECTHVARPYGRARAMASKSWCEMSWFEVRRGRPTLHAAFGTASL
eukprot:7380351-Prymnesium_polylepis.1